MIKQLSKRDSEWRKIALKICGCKQLADDLVNDMYLKLHKINPSKANTSYVSYAIYHLFLAHVKKENKKISLEDYHFNDILEDDNLEDRIELNEALKELSLYDREIMLHMAERSLRKNIEYLGISFSKLYHGNKNAIEKLKETEKVKELIKERWQNEVDQKRK